MEKGNFSFSELGANTLLDGPHFCFHICKIMSSHDASHIFVCFMYPSQ